MASSKGIEELVNTAGFEYSSRSCTHCKAKLTRDHMHELSVDIADNRSDVEILEKLRSLHIDGCRYKWARALDQEAKERSELPRKGASNDALGYNKLLTLQGQSVSRAEMAEEPEENLEENNEATPAGGDPAEEDEEELENLDIEDSAGADQAEEDEEPEDPVGNHAEDEEMEENLVANMENIAGNQAEENEEPEEDFLANMENIAAGPVVISEQENQDVHAAERRTGPVVISEQENQDAHAAGM